MKGASDGAGSTSGPRLIVTGAAHGIGRATAQRFVKEGARVTALDISEEGMDLAREAFAAEGTEVTLERADITAEPDVQRVVDSAISAHDRIDILANVAGIMDWFLPARHVDDETWERVMAVNVTGPMRLSRRVPPAMMRQHAGSIINVASIGGLRGSAAGAAYTTSKYAIIGHTRSVAWAYQTEGIRCNAVCPGGVETNIGTTSAPRSEWGIGRLAAIHGSASRMAQPDEIASLISWLASDEASNVNGATITAGGGWTAG